MTQEDLIFALPVVVLAVTLLVTGRLLVCAAAAVAVGRLGILLATLAGIALLSGALIAVLVAWFAYGVAHTGKGPGTDIVMLGVTLLPYLLLCWGLWSLAGRLRTRLRQWANARIPPAPGTGDDPPQ